MIINKQHIRGFTLIEVVIATFIVGMALIAIASTVQALTRQTAQIEETFIANLVANNALAELQFLPVWPEIGDNSSTTEMAGREWFYDIEVSETEVESLRRVDINAGLDNEAHISRSHLVGFISITPQIGARSVNWQNPQNFDTENESPNNPDDGSDLTPGNPNEG